jgi:tripeptidyl-peptidase-1
VTAVGATQIKPGATVNEPEEACETVIFSGGGFSNIFPSALSRLKIVNRDTDRMDKSGYLNSRKK